jgi:tetratricopeptide (TPR) repeat protein
LYCVGATALNALYAEPYGPWCERFEIGYRNARAVLYDETGAARTADLRGLDIEVGAFNALQAARLRAFLRHRRPEAIIGGTMLVHRLAAAELRTALDGPPPELEQEAWMQREYSAAIEACLQEAAALDRAGELAAAVAALRHAVALDGFDPRSRWQLGLVQERQREFAAAASSFTVAHLLSAGDPRPIGERANLFVRVGLVERALEDYGRSIGRDANYLPARYNRAAVLMTLGRRDEAAADVAVLERHGAEVPPAWHAPPAADGPASSAAGDGGPR